jgi:purine-nucleoside phosphorylase
MNPSATFAALTAAARANPPRIALVLGSGMGDVAQGMTPELSVSFREIPGLEHETSVAGHRGRVVLGDWAGRRVLVFEGRLHFYEGHPWEKVELPVRMAHALGARRLFLTNAAGGIHDALAPGSFMAIRDHIQWTRATAWLSPGPGALGPARSSPYSPRLLQSIVETARELGIVLAEGTYAALTGPCYETAAEIRALRRWGADAVGMSTAREIQNGGDLGMECAALSLITNKAAGLGDAPLDHREVLTTAATQKTRLSALLSRWLERTDPSP